MKRVALTIISIVLLGTISSFAQDNIIQLVRVVGRRGYYCCWTRLKYMGK